MNNIKQLVERYLKENGPKAKTEAFKNLPSRQRAWWIYCGIAVLGIPSAIVSEGRMAWGIQLLYIVVLTVPALCVALAMLFAPMGPTRFFGRIIFGGIGIIVPLGILVKDRLGIGLTLTTWIFVIAILWGIYKTYSKRAPETVKDKPDQLGTKAANMAGARLGHADGVWSGRAGDQDLFASIEDRAVVLGPPGAGKTAFLISQTFQWADTKRPFVCLDTKPEIFGITQDALTGQGYRVLVYNPTSGRGQRYNPIADLSTPEAIGELAAALVPSEDPADAVFNESARDLLDALISHLRATDGQASLPAIRTLISSFDGYQGLLRTLGNSPDPDAVEIAKSLAMTAANERLLGSIFGTLRANLRFLRYPNIRASLEASDFSLADIGGDRPVALFLQFEEHQRETTARLLSAMVAHIMRYLISHTARPPVLLLLDEIGTVPPVPGLIGKLNTIRSRNLPTWTYWQSLEQMQRYGAKADEGANLILGACDYQMVFRLNDNASAKWMSDRIGVVDVTVRSENVGPDLISSVSESASLVTEPKIFTHELQQLQDGQVVCTYRDLAWRGEATPYFKIWPQYQGKRPKGEELFGEPYPEAKSDAA